MGPVGAIVGQEVGGVAGREGASKLAKAFGAGKNGQEVARNIGNGIGRLFGGATGGFLSPFAKGGRVPAKKGVGFPALLHGQEYVLPVGVKPTRAQVQFVKKKGGRYL